MSFATDRWFSEEEIASLDAPAAYDKAASTAARKAQDAEMREKIRLRLIGEGDYEMASKLDKCGVPLPLVCTCCGSGKVVEMRCKKRWCPACQWAVQKTRMERFGGALKMIRWPLFVTLTARNSDDPESIRKIREDWGRFRRRKIIAEKVSGGVVALEVTNNGNGWHPHLHCVVGCEWLSLHTPPPHWQESKAAQKAKCEMAQMELSRRWAESIGQEEAVVWVKRIKDDGALTYSLKYSVKGSDLVESKNDIGPVIRVMERTRLISAFGDLYGRTSEMVDDDREEPTCTECGNAKSFCPVDVIDMMRRSDPMERAGVVCFKPGSPGWKGGVA